MLANAEITEINMLGWAILIFLIRFVDVSVETVRLILVVNNHKWIASAVAAIDVTLWCWMMSEGVFAHKSWVVYTAYGLGFAAGQIAGCGVGHKLNDKLKSKGK